MAKGDDLTTTSTAVFALVGQQHDMMTVKNDTTSICQTTVSQTTITQ